MGNHNLHGTTKITMYLLAASLTLLASASASPLKVTSAKAASPYVNIGCQCSPLTFQDQYGSLLWSEHPLLWSPSLWTHLSWLWIQWIWIRIWIWVWQRWQSVWIQLGNTAALWRNHPKILL